MQDQTKVKNLVDIFCEKLCNEDQARTTTVLGLPTGDIYGFGLFCLLLYFTNLDQTTFGQFTLLGPRSKQMLYSGISFPLVTFHKGLVGPGSCVKTAVWGYTRFYSAKSSSSGKNSKNKWLARQKKDPFTREARVLNLRSRAAFKLKELDDKYRVFQPKIIQNVLDLGFAPGSWSEVARQRCHPDSMIMGVDILPCDPPKGVSALQANILSQRTQDLIRLYFVKHHNVESFLENNDSKSSSKSINDIEFEEELHNEEEYREVFEPDEIDDKKEPIQSELLPIDVILSDMYVPLPRLDGFSSNITNQPYHRLMNTSGVAIRDHLLSVDLCDAALVTAIDLLKPNGSFICKLYTGKEDKLFEKRLKKVFKIVNRFKPVSSRNESKEIYFVGLGKFPKVDKLKVFG